MSKFNNIGLFLSLLTVGLPKRSCSLGACQGGVKRIGIIDREDITSFTYDTGITPEKAQPITAIVFEPSATVKQFVFEKETKQLTETGTTNKCSTTYEQSLAGTYLCPNVQEFITASAELEESSCCGMVVFVEFFSGVTKVIGDIEDFEAEVDTIVLDSGAALEDQQTGIITVKCKSPKQAVIFTAGFDTLPL